MSVMRLGAARPVFLVAVLSLCAVSTAVAEDELEAVVVTAARVAQPVSEVIGSVTVITREEIEQRQVRSLPELLRGEVGLDISNQGGQGKLSSIFLRGANSTQTLVLVDGVRLGSATAGITAIELIPVEQIERIEIVRGPRSSLYGSDAMGGVIQIFTRNSNGFTGSVGAGTYNTQSYSAGFGMHSNSLRFSVNGNYIQSEGFNSCTGDPITFAGCGTFEPDKDGYRNSSATARVGYAFGKAADLELSTLYAKGYTESDGDYGFGPPFAAPNQTYFKEVSPTLKLTVKPIDNLDLLLVAGNTRDDQQSFNNGRYLLTFNTEKRNLSLQGDWRITPSHALTLGADYLKDEINTVTDPTNLAEKFAVDHRDNTGVYLQYLGKLGTHEVSGSVRRDDNEQFGTHNTGNLGWKWFVLDKALAVNAGWGQAFHAPTFNDLYYPNFGNPNLRPERTQSYELGATGEVKWLTWSLQVYSTKAKDLIVFDPNIGLPNNVSEARLQGAELSISGRWDKLTAGVNYTAQNPRNRQAGANYDHILVRRSRQAGRLDVNYDLGPAQIGTTVNVAGKRYDDVANSVVLAGYTTVDFKANIDLCKTLALQVKLGNFFDRQYETARFYNQEGRTVFVTLRYQPK